MIAGVGTDILQISRIEQSLERTPGLAARILTVDELRQFNETPAPARFLAKRFCAKEAITKALGTGIGRGVSWQHIEIQKDAFGRPEVTLSGGAEARMKSLGVANIQLSYSDEKAYVVAFAVAER